MPIATYLWGRGCSVSFANLSFSNLWDCGGERIDPNTWLIDANSKELPYFPEKWLAEWLRRRSCEAPVYAFAKTGVEPLRAAYQALRGRHAVDLVILVDGGTDSLIFGDEPGLGTVVEDAVSVIAACDVAGDRTLLAALGFGVDHFHGVSHHLFLENVARLSRTGGNLGGITLVQEHPQPTLSLIWLITPIKDSPSTAALFATRLQAPCAASLVISDNQPHKRDRAFYQPAYDTILDLRRNASCPAYGFCGGARENNNVRGSVPQNRDAPRVGRAKALKAIAALISADVF